MFLTHITPIPSDGHSHGPNGECGSDHGHSHGGNDHGHSHGGNDHGHSHGGNDHGHSHGGNGGGHGHSHGGKACNHNHGGGSSGGHSHSHGGGHGHSHGGDNHGHSHGGKPCNHNHGGGGHGHSHGGGGAAMDPIMQRKMRAVELFMRTMMVPKLPLIFAHFHPTTKTPEEVACTATVSGGIPVPDNKDERMTRDEFRDLVYAIHSATARADRHGIVRPSEVAEMEQMFLAMMGIQAAPEDDSITIPQPLLLQFLTTILSRIAIQRYDAMPYLLQEFGLPTKCPKIPLTPADESRARIEGYIYDNIVPHLSAFVLKAAEENKDSESPAARCGLVAAVDSMIEGLDQAPVTQFTELARQHVLNTKAGLEQIVPFLKVDAADAEPHPRLVIFHLVQKVS